jgi:Xaa-Pro aminopeptidase
MLKEWSPEWSTPVFSLEERGRRWEKVRKLMSRDRIDVIVCLPMPSRHGRGQQEARYLSQLGDHGEETAVIFPLEGDVTVWQSRSGPRPTSNWLADIRAMEHGAGGAAVISRLREMKINHGTIAVAGLTGGLLARVRSPEGEVNWQSINMIKDSLPNAKIVSATNVLGEARHQKSDEEIEFIKKATGVAEKIMQAVIETGGDGVPERYLFAKMLHANAEAGGNMPAMFGWISGTLGDAYTRLEQPSFRKLKTGDIMILEIECCWGGYFGQIDQAFSIGPAHQDFIDGNKLAWTSFNRVFDALRPGVKVAELVKAGEVNGLNGRGLANLTMHGRGTGDDGPLVVASKLPSAELSAVELKEGCCLVVKQGVRIDGRPDYGRWGDSVVIRRNRAERLGSRRQQLYELI